MLSSKRFVCMGFWHVQGFLVGSTVFLTLYNLLSFNLNGVFNCLAIRTANKCAGQSGFVSSRISTGVLVFNSSQTTRRCIPSVLSSSLSVDYCGYKVSNGNVVCKCKGLGAVATQCCPGVIVLSVRPAFSLFEGSGYGCLTPLQPCCRCPKISSLF